MLLQIFFAALSCTSMLIASSLAAPSANIDRALPKARVALNGTLSKRDQNSVQTSAIPSSAGVTVPFSSVTCPDGNGDGGLYYGDQCYYDVLYSVAQAIQNMVGNYGGSTNSFPGYSPDGQVCATFGVEITNYDAFEQFQLNIEEDGSEPLNLANYILSAMEEWGFPVVCALFYNGDGWLGRGVVTLGWNGACWGDTQSLAGYC